MDAASHFWAHIVGSVMDAGILSFVAAQAQRSPKDRVCLAESQVTGKQAQPASRKAERQR